MHGLPQFIIAILLLSLTAFSSCTPSRVGEAMRRADSLMTSAPDSALALLDSIDPATLRTDAARARHAVLLTRARHLADVPVYDDSIIAIGTDYYATHGTHAEKAEAFYMSSVVNHYNNRYEQSIVDGLRAEKHALATSDHLLLGLIYRTIADGFDRLYDWSSALHYYTLSYDNFKLAPENIYTDWAFYDIARVNYSLGHFAKVAAILENHPETIDIKSDNPLTAGLLRLVAAANHYLHNYETTDSIYDYVSTMQNNDLIATDYRLWGQSAFKIGDLESALVCKDSLYLEDSSDRTLDCELAKFRHEYAEAFDLLEQSISEDNDKLSKVLERNYAATISGYYDKEEAISNNKLEKNRLIIVILSIASALIIVSLIAAFYYRARILRQEKEMIMLEARDLRNILNEKESEVCEARSVSALAKENVRGLLASRFDILDRLCSTYFQFKGLSNERDKISNEVLSIISEIQNDRQILGNLESLVDTNFDGLMARLRRDVPGLKERDYELYLYLLLDFSPRAISILQGIRTEAVYNRKSVLKRKITESGSESTQEYLSHIL